MFTRISLSHSLQLRAITVLQRDLRLAEDRIKKAEASSKSLAEQEVIAMPPPQTPISPASSTSGLSRQPTDLSPSEVKSPVSSTSTFPARRPSAISISSLHRPAFPLKLDLSTTSLRATTQESSMFSDGLASPVTLAPKSARAMGPNEFPPELMAAFATASAIDSRPVDIDLTIPQMDVEPTKGDSSDKPIELDLDDMEMDIDMSNMTDLFGDPTDTNSPDMRASVDDLFSPVDGDSVGPPSTIPEAASSKEGDNFLNQFGVSEDMFASLDSTIHVNDNPLPPQPPTSPTPSSAARPTSPRSLANTFSSTSEINDLGQVGPTELPADATFDLNSFDLSHLSPGFFATAPESESNFPIDMEDFLHMGDDSEGKT